MASPFEHAWRLLKMPLNNPGYGDDHPAMEERAKNQPPPQGANLEALPPAGPDPRVSRKYMDNPVQRGLDKYGIPSAPTDYKNSLITQLRRHMAPEDEPMLSQLLDR